MTKVFVGLTDGFEPEVRAMLGAKYSRDVGSIVGRLPASDESIDKHKESMEKFYVGYGHKSVGQLASTDIYIEGVSQLAAKAIENHPLFNGQESSTRYIDFTNQPMVSPTPEIAEWQETWRAFYLKALNVVQNNLMLEFPFESQPEGTKDSVWNNTIRARAFDMCRGFLPAGVTTNVVMTASFDVINDHFGEMLLHPSSEMKDLAHTVIESMSLKYPYATFPLEKLLKSNEHKTIHYFYQDGNPETHAYMLGQLQKMDVHGDNYRSLPRFESRKTRIEMNGSIDFGSYRDLHRHRNGYINMPVLTTFLGFHDFYVQNLPTYLKAELAQLLVTFENWYKANPSKIEKQYAVPMGYKVALTYNCDVQQAHYLLRLRSGKTVHQTLRHLCQQWASQLNESLSRFPEAEFVYDDSEDNFTLRRGTQTFQNT